MQKLWFNVIQYFREDVQWFKKCGVCLPSRHQGRRSAEDLKRLSPCGSSSWQTLCHGSGDGGIAVRLSTGGGSPGGEGFCVYRKIARQWQRFIPDLPGSLMWFPKRSLQGSEESGRHNPAPSGLAAGAGEGYRGMGPRALCSGARALALGPNCFWVPLLSTHFCWPVGPMSLWQHAPTGAILHGHTSLCVLLHMIPVCVCCHYRMPDTKCIVW